MVPVRGPRYEPCCSQVRPRRSQTSHSPAAPATHLGGPRPSNACPQATTASRTLPQGGGRGATAAAYSTRPHTQPQHPRQNESGPGATTYSTPPPAPALCGHRAEDAAATPTSETLARARSRREGETGTGRPTTTASTPRQTQRCREGSGNTAAATRTPPQTRHGCGGGGQPATTASRTPAQAHPAHQRRPDDMPASKSKRPHPVTEDESGWGTTTTANSAPPQPRTRREDGDDQGTTATDSTPPRTQRGRGGGGDG